MAFVRSSLVLGHIVFQLLVNLALGHGGSWRSFTGFHLEKFRQLSRIAAVLKCFTTETRRYHRTGLLQECRYAATSTGIYLYYPQRSQVHPKLRAFIEHIKNYQKLK
jgi:hypothetical protein